MLPVWDNPLRLLCNTNCKEFCFCFYNTIHCFPSMLCLFHPLLLFHFCILHQQMLKHLYPASFLAIFFTFVKDELSAVFPWLFTLMSIDLTLAWLRRIRKIYGEEEIRRDFFGVNVRYFFQNRLDVKMLLITSFQKIPSENLQYDPEGGESGKRKNWPHSSVLS